MSNNTENEPTLTIEMFLNNDFVKQQIFRFHRLSESVGGDLYDKRRKKIIDILYNYTKKKFKNLNKEYFVDFLEKAEETFIGAAGNSIADTLEVEYEQKAKGIEEEIIKYPDLQTDIDSDPYDLGRLECFNMHYYKTLPPERLKWVFSELFEFGQITGLAAVAGIGKTWLGLDMALTLANYEAGNFLSFDKEEDCLVYFITMEDNAFSLQERMMALSPSSLESYQCDDLLHILPGIDAFNGDFSLVNNSGGKFELSEKYKTLLLLINREKSFYGDIPVVVIFDTYSATLHGDENTSSVANEWFKAANLLIKYFNAAVIVTHHIRKTKTQEYIRTPDDLLLAIRGSNAFVNSCRRVCGMWPLSASEIKKITGPTAKLFNFSVLKDNGRVNWKGKDVEVFDRQTITLTRHENGCLILDPDINAARKELHISKRELSGTEIDALEEHLIEIIEHYAKAGYPLSKSVFDKQQSYKDLLKPEYLKYPPKTLRSAVNNLINSKKITLLKIKINNKKCDIYDLKNGPYAKGDMTERTLTKIPVSPYAEHEDGQS